MTARHIHSVNHPGTATPIGQPVSVAGGTPGQFTPNPLATQPIGGLVQDIDKIWAAYQAGADKFGTAHTKVKSIHDSVFPTWEGASSREGERATTMAVGRAKYALDALTQVGQAMKEFSAALTAAKAKQLPALNQLGLLIPPFNMNPSDPTIQSEIRTQERISLSAQQDAADARRRVESAIVHSSTVMWYTVPNFTARFDPITAAIIDSLVAHHWMTRQHAQMVAGRLGKLSAKDYKTFAKMEATAATDKERSKLYTELAKGTHMSKIVASDKVFHVPPPVHHAPAVAASGGTASTWAPAAAAPVVVAPVVTPTRSTTTTTTRRPSTTPSPRKPAPTPKPKAALGTYTNPYKITGTSGNPSSHPGWTEWTSQGVDGKTYHSNYYTPNYPYAKAQDAGTWTSPAPKHR